MNKVIAFLFFLTVALFFTQKGYTQVQYRDVIYLKNGGITKGVIIEQIPNESFKIETYDGSVFVYKVDEVEKVTREPMFNKKKKNLSIPNVRRLEPALSFLLSFLVPGVGQMYNGQIGKGIGMLCGSYAGMFIGASIVNSTAYYANYSNGYLSGTALFGSVLMLAGTAITIWSWIDAPVYANRRNRDYGLALGKGAYLNISPDLINITNTANYKSYKTTETAFGMKLQLTF